MIKFSHQGNFNKTETFFDRTSKSDYLITLNKYGQEGVNTLSTATPVDSGETRSKWKYEIHRTSKGVQIIWSNSHNVNGVPIAIILQYGHGTRNGGYVQGRDYINPAMRHIFDKIMTDVWEEVTKI